MFSRISFPIILSLLCICPVLFASGPWTQNKNGGYTQLSFSSIASRQLFNKDGGTYELYRKVHDRTLQGYIEYGITNYLTLIGNIPFKIVSTGDETFQPDTLIFIDTFPAGQLSGLSNISVALKYGIINSKWKLSAQIKTDTRTSVSDVKTGLQTGYDCWSYQPSVFFGGSQGAAYFSVSAGITLRSNNFSESFHTGGEVGYGFFKQKTYVILLIDLNKSFFNDSIQNLNFLRTGLYVNNQEYLSYGIKINQLLSPRWNVNFGIYGASYGNLVAHDPSINFGIAYRWD